MKKYLYVLEICKEQKIIFQEPKELFQTLFVI